VLGATWFCDQVLPLVQVVVPDVRFAVVGRHPAPEVMDLAGRAGVEVHADVPRMQPWLEWARVVVVPLHVGTGTRVKALEALAAGRPVVGTRIGLQGLDLVDGTHARIVDDPRAMADSIIELLTEDEHAEALVRAGRAHVEERYGWNRVAQALVPALLAPRVNGRFA
jgi:glycosyltransferase involved in cell wall biosynthesis